MKVFKVGIVGLGWVAESHIHAMKRVEGLEVVAAYSNTHQDESQLAKQYDLPIQLVSDYQSLVDDPEIDIIDICTPNHLHFQQASLAIEAGKHLILEKPVCLKFEELKTLRQIILKNGVQVCVGFECRFTDHFTMIRSIIDQGLIGKIHYAEVDYYHGIGPWNPQFEWNIKKEGGGSSLLTAGCHAMDALLFFTDSQVTEVTGWATRSQSPEFSAYEYPTTSLTTLKFENPNIVAKVTSSIDCLQPYYFHVHLLGSEGTILDNKFYSTKLPGMHKHQWTTLETSFIDSKTSSNHPYKKQFQIFLENLRENKPMPLTDFETAYHSHRAVFAADLSAEIGRSVALTELS